MRSSRGDETRRRLQDWSEAQKAGERLAAQILAADGFTSVDPTHPLGGPDGLKDLVCEKNGNKWVAAAYFPRGQKPLATIRKKFAGDSKGTQKANAVGFAFVTNQRLTEGERLDLANSAGGQVEVYHLERVATILDQPKNFGLRLEYLDIEMTKEEQVSFFSALTERVDQLNRHVAAVFGATGAPAVTSLGVTGVPLERLGRIAGMLDRFAGSSRGGLLMAPLDRLESVAGRLEKVVRALGLENTRFGLLASPVDRWERAAEKLTEAARSAEAVARSIDHE